jgi:hypothetical protein
LKGDSGARSRQPLPFFPLFILSFLQLGAGTHDFSAIVMKMGYFSPAAQGEEMAIAKEK